MTGQFLFEIEKTPGRVSHAPARSGEAVRGRGVVAASPTPRKKRKPQPQVPAGVQPTVTSATPYVERRFEDEIDGVEDTSWRLLRETINPYVIARFCIDGEPTSKSRPRFVQRGGKVATYTPKKTVDAENIVAWQFRQTRPDWVVDETGGFGVFAVFFAETYQRRDVDNMLKLVLDALNKVVWADDSQVTEVSGRAARGGDGFSGPPRTAVLIYRCPPAGTPPTGTCEKCGKTFRLYKSTSKQRFCSRYCSGVAAATRMTRSTHRVKSHACARCGAAFIVTGNQWHQKKYCSAACQHQGATDDLTCVNCGKQFKQWTSWKPSGPALCSKKCGVAYWRSNGTKSPKGTCEICGGPVSRREYKRCRACVRAATPGRARGPAVRPITDLSGVVS